PCRGRVRLHQPASGRSPDRNEARMSKRRHYDHSNRNEKSYNVEPLYTGTASWDPLANPAFDRRDQSYIRKVKPQNANQALLLEAMAKNHLVVAAGPAGTGKTYLAISAAVEALE